MRDSVSKAKQGEEKCHQLLVVDVPFLLVEGSLALNCNPA
jgi:hypothetical protein